MLRAGYGAVILVGVLVVLNGCSEDRPAERYEVRGEVVRLEYGGLALRIDHEAIPDVMEAMRMSFRLQSPEEARDLQPGDRISFMYVVKEEGSYIRDIERLPPDTELDLESIDARHSADVDDG